MLSGALVGAALAAFLLTAVVAGQLSTRARRRAAEGTIAGHHQGDPSSADRPVADYLAAYEDEMEPLKKYDAALFGGTPTEVPVPRKVISGILGPV